MPPAPAMPKQAVAEEEAGHLPKEYLTPRTSPVRLAVRLERAAMPVHPRLPGAMGAPQLSGRSYRLLGVEAVGRGLRVRVWVEVTVVAVRELSLTPPERPPGIPWERTRFLPDRAQPGPWTVRLPAEMPNSAGQAAEVAEVPALVHLSDVRAEAQCMVGPEVEAVERLVPMAPRTMPEAPVGSRDHTAPAEAVRRVPTVARGLPVPQAPEAEVEAATEVSEELEANLEEEAVEVEE